MTVLRSLARLYTTDLEALLDGLEPLGLGPSSPPFEVPGAGVRVCSVGRLLIVAGTDEALEPFRATNVTLLVDDLDATLAALLARGATVVRGIRDVPTGRNATVEVTGGTVTELVEWSDEQWARSGGRPDAGPDTTTP